MPPDTTLEDVARARVGRTLRGKYRLDRVLGTGGMATVYVATHRNAKQFAVKMLHPTISLHESIRTRFLREGYLANSVKHPGAVAVLDDDVAEDGSAFLVMELLEGSPLDDVWLRHDRHLPVSLALSIGEALLDVLVAAHAHGIVHRDLKPANLFLTRDGALKVLDFGIARLHDESGGGGTVTGATLGTPAFMAPEQALAKASEIDAQTDLWAVGATLFTLISGSLVHEGENASQLLVAAATKHARSLAVAAPTVPTEIVTVVDRALAFDKRDRWPSAAAMREALQNASVEALSTPIAILPKSALPSGADATALAISSSGSGGSSRTAFGSTVEAPSDREVIKAATPRFSTEAALAKSARTSLRPRSRLRRLLGAAVACAVVASAAVAYRAAHAPRTTYCAEVVDSIDGPRCVRPLPPGAQSRRGLALTLAITMQGGRVTEVRYEDFAGRPDFTEYPQPSVAQIDVVRGEDGALVESVARDERGRVLSRDRYSQGGHVLDITGADGEPAGLDEAIDNPQVTRVLRDFDARGFVARETFFGPTGRPRTDSYGAYGYAIVSDASGRPTRRAVLGDDGEPGVDRDGCAHVEIAYDDLARTRVERRFDSIGRPTVRNGVHATKSRYDGDGQLLEVAYEGPHGEPVVGLGMVRYHARKDTWNAAKRTLERTFLDEKEMPRPARGETWTTMRNTFDAQGRRVLHEHLDGNGNRVRDRKEGATGIRTTWNDHDETTTWDLLDGTDALTQGSDGYARQAYVRDDRGFAVETRSFDEGGRLVAPRDGSAIERATFDDRGLVTSTAYFGADDKPAANAHGVAIERSKFDRLRNEVERSYFGVDGAPVANDEGFAVHAWSYDAGGDLVGESYFDVSGQPVIVHGDYASRRLVNDDRGLVTSEEYLDVHGERILKKTGYAAVTYERDTNGDVVLERYFGKRGEPIENSDCLCAKKKLAYDMHRRLVETTVSNVAGEPPKEPGRWTTERTTYDDRGEPVRIDHVDGAGAPVLTVEDGAASVAKTYDPRGNLIEESLLGKSGEPITGLGGFATTKSLHDERDEETENALFGPDGKPALGTGGWSVRRFRYNDVGNRIEDAAFDTEHRLVVPQGATYASVRSAYDARQRLVEAAYFDASEAPATGPEGASVVRYERDAYGHATEVRYLDASGAASPSSDGKLVVRIAYDSAGRKTDERSLDAAGAPHTASDGCAERRTKYDPQGRVVEEDCLGPNGAPTLSTEGWASRRTQHDARGNAVDVSTYGVDGALRGDKDGVARKRSTFDERGNVLDTALFDVHDKPTHDRTGLYGTMCSYDDAGRKTGEMGKDAQGRALTTRTSRP